MVPLAVSSLPITPTILPRRCPRCGDDLELAHTTRGRPHHILGCRAFPQCSFTADYDSHLHALLQRLSDGLQTLSERLAACEARLDIVEGRGL